MADLSRFDPRLPSRTPHQPAPATGVPRLSRRQFLRGGASAVAGITALTSGEWLHPHTAQAQQAGGAVVSKLLLLGTSTTRVEGNYPKFCDPNLQLLVGRHAIRFDYQFAANGPQTIPADLVATYRDRLCDFTNELEPVLRPAPFQKLSDTPQDFPPPPPLGRYMEVDRYRLVQTLTPQKVRVYEWASYYCAEGNDIIIQVGGPNGHLQFSPKDPGVGPPIPVHIENAFPDPHFGNPHSTGKPDVALGTVYYVADNQEEGWSEETLWTTNLPIRDRQDLRVDIYIPGAADPSARTAQAIYEVTHADGTALVKISQHRAVSGWVNLGTFTFNNGTATVHLTNETGEPAGDKEVVANAARWANA